jgi:hypothetical protein
MLAALAIFSFVNSVLLAVLVLDRRSACACEPVASTVAAPKPVASLPDVQYGVQRPTREQIESADKARKLRRSLEPRP